MNKTHNPKVAILNPGTGNLYSVAHACKHTGIDGFITSDPEKLHDVEAVILPGVGAYPKAIETLNNSGLSEALLDLVPKGLPLMGICLGYQLLLTASEEYGIYDGLGLIKGTARPLFGVNEKSSIKIPNINWAPVFSHKAYNRKNNWNNSLLAGIEEHCQFYFIHSYYAEISEIDAQLANSRFHDFEFCCAIQKGNIFGCQFHPERSGETGLGIYRNFRKAILKRRLDMSGFNHIKNKSNTLS